MPPKVSSRASLPSYQLPIYREPITALNVGFQSAANFRRRSQFWGELKFLQIRNYLHRRLKTLKTDWHKQSYLPRAKYITAQMTFQYDIVIGIDDIYRNL